MIIRTDGTYYFSYKGVVIIECARWISGVLHSLRDIIENVPQEISRTAQQRLSTQAIGAGVQAEIRNTRMLYMPPSASMKSSCTLVIMLL